MIENMTKLDVKHLRRGDYVMAVTGSPKTNNLEIVTGKVQDFAIRSLSDMMVVLDAIIATTDGRIIQSGRIYEISKEVAERETEIEDEVDTHELTITDIYPHHDDLLHSLEIEYNKYLYGRRNHMTHKERIEWQIDYKMRKQGAINRAHARVMEFLDLIATLNADYPLQTA